MEPKLIIKSASDGLELYKYPLIGVNLSKVEEKEPKIHFQSTTQSHSNDFIYGTIYTPLDNTIYMYKLTIANVTHNSLTLAGRTQLNVTNVEDRHID